MRLGFFAMHLGISVLSSWTYLSSPGVLESSTESWEVMKEKQEYREGLHHLTPWAGCDTLLPLHSFGKN